MAKDNIPFVGGSAYTNDLIGSLKNKVISSDNSNSAVTYDSIANKTLGLMSLVLAVSVFSFSIAKSMPGVAATLMGISIISVVVLSIALFFMRSKPMPAWFTIAFATAEGFLIGIISKQYSTFSGGIVFEALLITLVVCFASALVFKSGIIKRNYSKVSKFIAIALFSYFLLIIFNFILVALGVFHGGGIWTSQFGIIISIVIVLFGGLMLSRDLTAAQIAIEEGVSNEYSWSLSFAIVIDVIWIYLEVLRLLAILIRR